MEQPMTYVLHRTGGGRLPLAVTGKGCFLIDDTGRRYLDASGGAAVSCLGHGHPAVISAICDQTRKLAYAHTAFFTNHPLEALAEELVQLAPDGIAKAYFVSGGSEAMEAALKLVRQYFVERGEGTRRRFVARRQSYHGNTLGALAVGGNLGRRRLYEPLLMETRHIGPCYAYRHQRPGETLEEYGSRAAEELEAELLRLGPETVAGFVAEPVVGATAGAVPPAPGYFRRIREICDRYGVLLILDEVMCGMGRTGTLFACEQEGITPDVITIAKGLGAGYQPIGAMLLSGEIDEAIRCGSGSFAHGHTYLGHATACAAGLAVLRTILQEDLLHAVRSQGEYLAEALVERLGDHPHVGDIRGRGLLRGIELVQDRVTKAPFAPSDFRHARVKREAMARGLLCYPSGGTVDGTAGDHILIAPPYTISRQEIDTLVDRLTAALDAATDINHATAYPAAV
jgi:adenosylmethionine-8-amino-7-oxononanoate aminotransferase